MITVLYIDDEPGLLEIGRLFLEERGFKVDTEMSPCEAVNRMRNKPYDAVICDYQMPEMTGIEVLKNVREEFPNVPFILFTGRGREEVAIRALNGGANAYIQKGGDIKAQFAELEHRIKKDVEKENEKLRFQEKLNNHSARLSNIVEKSELRDEDLIEAGVTESGAEAGYIARVEGSTDEVLRTISSYGLRTSKFSNMIVPIKKDGKIVGLGPQVIYSQKGIILNNYLESDIVHDPEVDEAVKAEEIKAAMAVPIISEKGTVKKVFYAFSRKPDFKFTAKDLEVLLLSARYLAIVDQKRKARIEEERVNKKLALMSTVTRHAVKNHATVIIAVTELCLTNKTQGEEKVHLLMVKKAIENLVQEMENLEKHQQIRVNNPQWSSMAGLTDHYSKENPNVVFENRASDLEVFIDPDLRDYIVKYLISNSIIHGKATKIVIDYAPLPDGNLNLRCRDNGVGIEAERKEKIFAYGYGNHSSFSLFYTREVLEISGMSIKEAGEFGHGACFVINIPRESYRIKK